LLKIRENVERNQVVIVAVDICDLSAYNA